jgi:hypothetical protein
MVTRDQPDKTSSDTEKQHLFGLGRLSSIQIPATDTRGSGAFYASVFDWEVHSDGDDYLR